MSSQWQALPCIQAEDPALQVQACAQQSVCALDGAPDAAFDQLFLEQQSASVAADCTVLVTLPGTDLQEFALDKSASRLAEDHMEQVAKQVTNLSIAYIWTLPNCYAHRRS